MKKKIFVVLIVSFLLVFFLTGCYDGEEIDAMTYVIAMGLDEGEKENLKVTMQYVITSPNSGDGEDSENSTKDITLETASVYNAINMINNSLDKRLNFSHTKIIVISDKLAKKGELKKYLRPIMNSKEFRPNIYIAIAKSSAQEYLKSIKKLKKSNSARYYASKFSSYEYSGYYTNTQKDDFYYRLSDKWTAAVAPYVGIGKVKDSEDLKEMFKDKKYNKNVIQNEGYLAGEIPQTGDEISAQIMGTAVFKGDKMVGTLDGDESTHFLMLTGMFKNSLYTIEDPLKKDAFITLILNKRKNPEVKVTIKDDVPNIDIKVKLEGEYAFFESQIDYQDKYKNAILVNYAQKIMKEKIENILERSISDFNSDICSFGSIARRNFLTWDEWEEFDWSKKYKNSNFNVNVDVAVKMVRMFQ